VSASIASCALTTARYAFFIAVSAAKVEFRHRPERLSADQAPEMIESTVAVRRLDEGLTTVGIVVKRGNRGTDLVDICRKRRVVVVMR